MKFRKFRIAWSVSCGIAFLLLIVLWVRSYWYLESVLSVFGNVNSVRGTIVFNFFDFIYGWNREKKDWAVIRKAPERWSHNAPMRRWPPIRVSQPATGVQRVELEYWFLSPLIALLGIAAWQSRLRFRFSFRALLIATTLVAAALGLIVWSMR
jgi:hypothetical protein